jgi:hypothetical protein
MMGRTVGFLNDAKRPGGGFVVGGWYFGRVRVGVVNRIRVIFRLVIGVRVVGVVFNGMGAALWRIFGLRARRCGWLCFVHYFLFS